jgi:hypothetical protein
MIFGSAGISAMLFLVFINPDANRSDVSP